MSPGKDQEYFSDGLAQELLHVLAKIEGLKVAARTSSFSFKGKDVDIETIAETLDVASVLEGSVRKSGNRVRITAQLVNAADGFHLWSETFDRELDDIFAVQDEIARSVVESLEVTLLGDAAELPRARQENTEAYTAYLQGRYFLKQGGGENLGKAIAYLREAVALDPGYALAWAWLGGAYGTQASAGYAPVEEGVAKAREMAQRALTLDEAEPQAWVSLAYIRMSYDWDWVGAEEAFRRALELEPGSSEALRGLGRLTKKLGRFDEAIELARRSLERDPLDAGGHRLLGDVFWLSGRLEEAEAPLKKALELRPEYGTARSHLGLVYLAQSKPEAALEEMERVSRPGQRLFGLALAYHSLDRQEEAEAALAQFVEGQEWSYGIASVYAFRGEPDRAFEWLERAYAERESDVNWIKIDPNFRNLHDDPRWPVFLEKMGLAG
jgi:TolB-like protein/cytochrome c-type biogenesis protein CcmH/NrfG